MPCKQKQEWKTSQVLLKKPSNTCLLVQWNNKVFINHFRFVSNNIRSDMTKQTIVISVQWTPILSAGNSFKKIILKEYWMDFFFIHKCINWITFGEIYGKIYSENYHRELREKLNLREYFINKLIIIIIKLLKKLIKKFAFKYTCMIAGKFSAWE